MPVTIEPDAKDWTWVLERPCPECGFDARAVGEDDLAPAVADNAARWSRVLEHPEVRVRPRPEVWSPLEYACHVRDVDRLFAERVRLMLTEDDPRFANWDQDLTAVEDRYDLQDPERVAGELCHAAAAMSATYRSVTGDRWSRTGRRSDGSVFTVSSLGRYHLHDLVHHVWDVRHLDADPQAGSGAGG